MCIRDRAYAQGYRCLVMGEVGIGNTTPAAALISVFTGADAVSYTHLRAHETVLDLVCRLLLEKKNNNRK